MKIMIKIIKNHTKMEVLNSKIYLVFLVKKIIKNKINTANYKTILKVPVLLNKIMTIL